MQNVKETYLEQNIDHRTTGDKAIDNLLGLTVKILLGAFKLGFKTFRYLLYYAMKLIYWLFKLDELDRPKEEVTEVDIISNYSSTTIKLDLPIEAKEQLKDIDCILTSVAKGNIQLDLKKSQTLMLKFQKCLEYSNAYNFRAGFNYQNEYEDGLESYLMKKYAEGDK